MQSNNPVFRNSSEFNGKGTNAYGNEVYGGSGAATQGYGQPPVSDPSTWSTGTPGMPTHTTTERMTIDSVVMRTGLTLLVVLIAAFATWTMTPAISDTSLTQSSVNQLYTAMAIGSIGAFILSLVNSFKRVVSPALVLVFAAFEGVFIGAISKFFDYAYGDGIVIQAVIGTFAAFVGTLAAYKFFNIKVTTKFRRFVIAASFGFVGLMLLQLVVSLFGGDLGFSSLTGIGFLFSIAGLVLGVFMLILDFDFVENGVRAGLPERESWRAAFGLTVSLVWIYINLLRILAAFRN